MIKNFGSLTMILAVMLMIYGCSGQSGPVAPDNSTAQIAEFTLPDGATMSTATFHIFVTQAESQPVNIYRITADWQEMSATWNNFGQSFNGMNYGSFTPAQPGWYEVDLGSLASAWMDGSTNFGFLMDQSQLFAPSTIFDSRESDSIPYMVIDYMLNDQPASDTLYPIADTYIDANSPDQNYGSGASLYTGWPQLTDLEQQSLIRFDIGHSATDTVCTHGLGYWKTHAGFGPQANEVSQYLPLWLGDINGDKSLYVTYSTTAVGILVMTMKKCGGNSNGITKLYAQLLAAKLNLAAGADGSVIDTSLSNVDTFLANHDQNDWDTLSTDDQQMVLSWKSTLDDYNNGVIGPGSCDNDCPGMDNGDDANHDGDNGNEDDNKDGGYDGHGGDGGYGGYGGDGDH